MKSPQTILKSVAIALVLSSSAAAMAQSTPAPKTWYVSSKASPTNRDGKSWNTAWTELDQINWAVIKPGDTIKIDGGTDNNPGRYNRTLKIGASGTSSMPITIMSADEPGRDGPVILSTNTLPRAQTGIDIGNYRDIRIIGRPKPYYADKSFRIVGFPGEGIKQGPASTFVRLKHLEISGNGYDQGTQQPIAGGAGLRLEGGVSCDNLTLRQNLTQVVIRPSSTGYNPSFSRCLLYTDNYAWPYTAVYNADGVRIEDAPKQGSRGYSFHSCVFGPGLSTAIDCSQKGASLYIHDALFLNPKTTNVKRLIAPGNFNSLTMRHVTSYMAPLNYEKKPHSQFTFIVEPQRDSIANSIFWGGIMDFQGSGVQKFAVARNFQFKTSGNTLEISPTQEDPKFVTDMARLDQSITNAPHYSHYYSRITDYSLKSDSPARSVPSGSGITSVQSFITTMLQAPQ